MNRGRDKEREFKRAMAQDERTQRLRGPGCINARLGGCSVHDDDGGGGGGSVVSIRLTIIDDNLLDL